MNRFIAKEYGEDVDRDLVPDGLEKVLGLNVGNANSPPEDSDGDGLLDAEEVHQGSDPSNGNDAWASAGSFEATMGEVVPLVFTVGDHSGSHSEQWSLEFYKVADDGSRSLETTLRAGVGVLASREFTFTSGIIYEIELKHIHGEGDYDYSFLIDVASGAPPDAIALVDDPDGLTGVNDDVSLSSVEGTVTATIIQRSLKTQQGEELAVNISSGTRSPVQLKTGPAFGPGTVALTQNNDKIRVWSAETDGVELTGPGSANTRMTEWDLDDVELLALNTTNRIWIEGLETSDEIGDTTLTLAYVDADGNSTDEGVEIKITLLKVDLEFQNSEMSDWKNVKPDPSIETRIGVIRGDEIDFRIADSSSIPASQLSWSGEEEGTGDSISITFDELGEREVVLEIADTEVARAIVTVAEPTGPGEATWMALHLSRAGTAFAIRDEATEWAQTNLDSLGGGWTNGPADAARHSYWNGLMTMWWGEEDAEGLATAHEVSGLSGTADHNSTVMDLENNASGRAFVTDPDMTRGELDTAVRNALSSSQLVVMDEITNVEERGLLQQSNQ